MIEREIPLETAVNTFVINGESVTDLRDVERYMQENNLTTLAGTIADTAYTTDDFTSDFQAIKEDLFSNVDDTLAIDDSAATDIIDDATSTTGGGAAPKGFTPASP